MWKGVQGLMRGFLAGVIWGGVVAGAGLAVISQVAPLPGRDVAPGPGAVVEPEPAPLPKAPEAEPQPEILQKGPETAEAAADEAEAEAVGEAPAPEAPAAMAESPVATDLPPEETPAPEAEAAQVVDPETETALQQPADVPSGDPAAPDAPRMPEAQGALPQALADASVPGLSAPAGPDLPEAETAPAADAQPVPPAPDDPLLRPESPEEETAPAAIVPQPEPEPEPDVIAAAPGLEPAPDLPKSVPGVTIDRLPRIGDGAEESGAEAMPEADLPSAELVDVPSEGATPLDLFARPFENPEGKPLFSIVLIDEGVAPEDRGNLAALPFPVTFAIDPLAADSADAARVYRQAGQEVAMLATGIPTGATATDLEQTMQALDIALPEAVVVLDAPEGGVQAQPDLARQLVPIVAAQGRGLLTYDRGLNPADQVARREGVPSATIFRILDGEGESIPKMRNYLDRAAFKAAQEGKVIVIGRAHPETVAAILEWTVEGRAATVALAPVSAVLERAPSP